MHLNIHPKKYIKNSIQMKKSWNKACSFRPNKGFIYVARAHSTYLAEARFP